MAFDRFAYTSNNPVNYIDPSGFCEISTDENGKEYISKWDCTIDDFAALTWDERYRWMELFMEITGVEWFYNILGILKFFKIHPDFNDLDGWASTADAGVLQAINDGWRIYNGLEPIGHWFGPNSKHAVLEWDHAGGDWAEFFTLESAFAAGDPTVTEDMVRKQWGISEQNGVNYGAYAAQAQYRTAIGSEARDITAFLAVSNLYRSMITNEIWKCVGLGCGYDPFSVLFDPFLDVPLDSRTKTSQSFVFFSSWVIVIFNGWW